jgi:hypothetical protein
MTFDLQLLGANCAPQLNNTAQTQQFRNNSRQAINLMRIVYYISHAGNSKRLAKGAGITWK